MKRSHPLLLILLALSTALVLSAWGRKSKSTAAPQRTLQHPSVLQEQCRDVAGPARVEEVLDGIWVARGFDLANTIVIETATGKVVVDVSSTPERAAAVRAAVEEAVPGPVEALIYTHSHLDHVGGGQSWAEAATPVYGTERFEHDFFEKYGMFRPIESRRGNRQFGRHVSHQALPCTSIGKRLDMDSLSSPGVLLPNRTFTGQLNLEIGGVKIELHEAPGETLDQLFVWLPEREVLLPGDNFYDSFPNLYTIRGSRPRPVSRWIESLDAMRRKSARVLIPSHTEPIFGQDKVAARLTAYRDGIQWVRDQVVRGANEGLDLDQIVEGAGLPPELGDERQLRELYGQIDWSVRAIYANELGWFDGRAHRLYPLDKADGAKRTITMMGGAERVWAAARDAEAAGEARWTLQLLALLEDSGVAPPDSADGDLEVRALRSLAEKTANTNGRAYLLESAFELEQGIRAAPTPSPNLELVDRMPVDLFFEIMQTRVVPSKTRGIEESVQFRFSDTGEQWVLTLRNGILEVVSGEAIPGTPEPVAVVHTDTRTWRRLSTKRMNSVKALATGALKIERLPAFMRFMGRFDTSL
ncbi:MAG: alkyl sulfatase dimerization domain-containing protein [Myxococcota bacterium]|nr:alkyl sulfatase dimerization domain-containing protein [Myxococcota bacterium]